MQPEEEMWMWIMIGAIFLLGLVVVMWAIITEQPIEYHCLNCQEEVHDEGQFFCNEECKDQYKQDEQYEETRNFDKEL